MAVTQQDLEKFQGRKAIITHALPDGTASELEGTIEVVNEVGLVVKPKGKTRLEIIEIDAIEEVNYAPEPLKAIKATTLKPVEFGKARAHLLERHGYKLADINKMSEHEALDFHATLDHKDLDLGHVHATAQAATEATADEA